jgi:hypothetical protein
MPEWIFAILAGNYLLAKYLVKVDGRGGRVVHPQSESPFIFPHPIELEHCRSIGEEKPEKTMCT